VNAGQLAVLLLQSGHGEKAVALFQALLEINLFSPDFCGPGDYAFEDKASKSDSSLHQIVSCRAVDPDPHGSALI
jgi:hypothetical protein